MVAVITFRVPRYFTLPALACFISAFRSEAGVDSR